MKMHEEFCEESWDGNLKRNSERARGRKIDEMVIAIWF